MTLSAEPRHDLFAEFNLAVDDNAVFLGNEKGAVAFTRYTGDDVELHMCGHRGWATKTLLLSVYHYIWDVLQCRRCTVRIREDREDSLRINLRMGFRPEGYMREAEEGLGVWIFGMLREDCKYGCQAAAFTAGAADQATGPDGVAAASGADEPG